MRSVVSGKLYNVYSNNDYILAFLYRATSIQLGVAGLQAIFDVEGVENLDLSKEVSGHLRYPDLIGKILKRAGFEGIAVEDTDIEIDVGEIQLVDVETEGMKVDADAVQLRSQVDVLRVVDGEPVVANPKVGHSGKDKANLTRENPATATTAISGNEELDPLSGKSDMELLAELMAEPVTRPTPVTAASAPQPSTSSTEIPDLTRGMSDFTLEQRSTATIRSKPQPLSAPHSQTHGYDSDSEGGGIQMVDNDSDEGYDGALQELSHEPIPDDDLLTPSSPDPRESGKVPLVVEQKSLGSFPRGPTSSGSGSGGRIKASDLGLY